MPNYPIIDADGHLDDWHLEWQERFPQELRSFAPRSVLDQYGWRQLEVEGRLLPGGVRPRPEEIDRVTTRPPEYWPSDREGQIDPHKRLPDMDEMGIDVAVLFGGHCFLVESVVKTPETAIGALRVYNDYLAEYCAADPKRLRGVAMLPIQAPEEAARELRRAVESLGLIAGVVPPHHVDGTTLDDERLFPIYAEAQQLGVPICVHTIGLQINPAKELVRSKIQSSAQGNLPSMLALGHLIVGGVLDRFPELRFAFLEAGAGWVPHVADRLQSSYELFGSRNSKLRREPQEYVQSEQLYFATEPDELMLPAVAAAIGEDRLVCGSDYCHPEGHCPFTMKMLLEREDLSDSLKRKILYENPARLYGLKV